MKRDTSDSRKWVNALRLPIALMYPSFLYQDKLHAPCPSATSSYRMYDRPTMKGRLEIDESTFAEPRLQPFFSAFSAMSFVDRSPRGSRLIRGVATRFSVVPLTSSSTFRLGLQVAALDVF